MKRNFRIGRARALAGATFVLAIGTGFGAAAQSLSTANLRAVATYESVGLYWAKPGSTSGCRVQFRAAGTTAWTQGLDLWYDGRDDECRGSLVHLTPGTSYEVQVGPAGGSLTNTITFKTWSNTVPVAQTVSVAATSSVYNINAGGSASGYVVYDGGGATLDGKNSAQYNVTINASYVVLRNVKLTGAQQDAISIAENVHDVIIEDADISNWGRTRDGTYGQDMDSAVRAVCKSGPTLERVTVQRTKMHDPRWTANSWSVSHPWGPQGITFSWCGGNHVFRHNEIYSTNGNKFNDAIGGEDNFTQSGFPNADTDIYGNIISNTWDDGIEAEGGNENVRVWGNYIDDTGTGVASTVVAIGPMYIWRNVWNRSHFLGAVGLDQDDRQPMMKAGSDSANGHGRRYVFHNTMLQPTQSGFSNPLGGGYGMGGAGIGIWNTISKNNVWNLWKANTAFYETQADSTSERDMYNARMGDMAIQNGINATPQYASGNGNGAGSSGLYALAAGSPGYDQAVRIPNFNDAFVGNAPDVGAAEAGAAAMKFGVAGSAGSIVSGSTTNTPTGTTGTTGGTPTSGTPAAPPPSTATTGAVAMSASAAVFGPTTLTKTVTLTNTTSSKVTFMQASISSPKFNQSNNCTDVAAGASCSTNITYFPNYSGADTGTLTITSSAANSPHVISLAYSSASSGTSTTSTTIPAAPSAASVTQLVTHNYAAILRRAPDAAGQAYWESEAMRIAGLGVSLNQVGNAMAMSFLASPEYLSKSHTDTDFVTDLFNTFFNRAPDSAGLAFWVAQVQGGLPREVVLSSFMFSDEYNNYMTGIFGKVSARAEVDAVVDLFRGFLSRLPDSAGFTFWTQQFRAAQCNGAPAVGAVVESMTSQFMSGPEYAQRGRNNSQFVGDLYNALLRRGGDNGGVQYWVNQVSSGGNSREQVRRAFLGSPEFSARVNAIIAQGCAA